MVKIASNFLKMTDSMSQYLYNMQYKYNWLEMLKLKTKNQRQLIVILFTLVLITTIFASTVVSESSDSSSIYGFIIDVNPNQNYSTQAEISRLINKLLAEDVVIYWANSDISVSSQDIADEEDIQKRSFSKGSFIVSINDDSSINAKANFLTHIYSTNKKVKSYKILQPLKDLQAYTLIEPKIAHYDGEGVGSLYYWALDEGGFLNQKLLKPEEVMDDLDIEKYNVFIWGGQAGNFSTVLKDILLPPALTVRQKIRDFVRDGGGYVGSCYGGWRAASGYRRPVGYPLDLGYNRFLSFLPMQLDLVKRSVYRALPGGGDINVRITNPNHPIAFGLPEIIEHHTYWAGPMFLDNTIGGSNAETFGVIESIYNNDEDKWDWNFMMNLNLWWISKDISNETKMNIAKKWVDLSIGKPLWVSANFGKGKVVAFGGHPESAFMYDVSMDYSSPPRVVYNTIFYVASNGPYSVSLEKSYSYSKLNVDAGGPYTGLADRPIELKGKADAGTPPYSWHWEFEPPSWYDYYYYYYSEFDDTEETKNATVSYDAYGVYNAFLTVIDADGNIGYDSAEVQVVTYEPPEVFIDYAPYTYHTDEEIQFNCTVKNGLPPYSFYWEFDDWEESFDKDPIHSFKEPGTYHVTVEVRDQYNGFSDDDIFIDIIDGKQSLPNVSHKNGLIPLALVLVFIFSLVILLLYLIRKNKN